MFSLIVLVAVAMLAVAAVVGTVREVRRDGYRPTPTDPARQR